MIEIKFAEKMVKALGAEANEREKEIFSKGFESSMELIDVNKKMPEDFPELMIPEEDHREFPTTCEVLCTIGFEKPTNYTVGYREKYHDIWRWVLDYDGDIEVYSWRPITKI